MIYIKRIIIFICFFFLFDTLEVDSNYDKHLFYDVKDIYEESDFTVYFNDINSIELDNILKVLNIRIKSYIVEEEKYYAHNIDELVLIYTENKSLKDKIYYMNNGIKIDGIEIVCQIDELIKLENLTKII